ncbi:unnamed protein product [Adineta steineri]|uniref:EGF-like domain-containing protein n=1 Tax=Adineta steineri TaxID=433720 RepID=A0A819DMI4_9BILA|nr:unnamed protein product [Adineta steineri]CAF3838300.1 unnamed protein product [Adineta steineri]
MIVIDLAVQYLALLLTINQLMGISFNQPKFCPSTTWSSNAITFANASIAGACSNVIFINKTNGIYITENCNSQVQVWLEGNMTPVRTISTGLNQPQGLFVKTNDNVFIDNAGYNGRVEKWMLNSTFGKIVMNVTGPCYSLFIDINNTLYCSIGTQNMVVKVPLNSGAVVPTIAAGTGGAGSSYRKLNNPHGIFVDNNLTLYVADCNNNRIQSFEFNQTNGTTIAGNGASGTISLTCPTGIMFDADAYIFIVEYGGSRIIGSSFIGFRCIAGCSGPGSSPSQLNNPYSFSFDSYGNIFVADQTNCRIQKFLVSSNSCVETLMNDIESTTTSFILDGTEIFTTISNQNGEQLLQSFTPPTCPSSTSIGLTCSISSASCDMLNPCQNNGLCIDDNTTLSDYICLCPYGFDGQQCQNDYRPCQPHTCWNNGICNQTSNTTFYCLCREGWYGIHCEAKTEYCKNITCLNGGICRSSLLNYTCECLGESFSGRYCEMISTKTSAHRIVSKSFAFIVIVVSIITFMFVIVLDILKYCFNVDPMRKELQKLKQKKKKKKCPVIVKYVYVNAPSIQPSEVPFLSAEETAM